MSEEKLSKLDRLYEEVRGAGWNSKKYLVGQVLTYLEAVISDPLQRESAKSMFEGQIWNQDWYGQRTWDNFRLYAEANSIPFTSLDPTHVPTSRDSALEQKNPYLD